MARITRAGSFRRKSTQHLSKYETTLEQAFKEVDVERVTATSTITRVPDVILYDASGASIVLTIAVPASDPQAFNRILKVAEEVASANTITVQLVDGTAPAAATSGNVEYFIEDASDETTAPVLLS